MSDFRDPFADVPADTYAEFKLYHTKHPEIWKAFQKYALEATEHRMHYSAKSIMERVRWDCEIVRRGEFKISNSFTAYYARAFARKYPMHRKFFELKKIRGLTTERQAA